MRMSRSALAAGLLAHAMGGAPATAQTAGGAAEVRVAFDRRGVTSVQARGPADRAAGRRVAAGDPVRVASVSKLAVALGVMRLVEKGTLSLDRDVSDYLGWRLRNPAFPEVPVTLRLLLSHRSSITDDADYIIPLGTALRDWMQRPAIWDAAHAPGTWFRYTNLNFPVIASVIEAATGRRFDAVMQAEVFAPLGIDACFNWSGCGAGAVAHAVVLYNEKGEVRRDDLKGAPPPCLVVAEGACDLSAYRPGDNGALFGPQGGLRISPLGLARIGRMLLAGGEGFLTPASIAEIERPHWTFDGANGDSEQGFYCAYGLAVQLLATRAPGCADDPFGDGRLRSGHAGSAYNLRSGLWIDRRRGRGVAYFVTAVPDTAGPGRRSAFTPDEERLARGR
ncbi:serine hydrolase domain-containing protein [Sphingomonas canadensis]|uniref:Serine hydrolase domain-containing protein n=1 Tax=Sphingomonas canadensis TaxID=1219257 RepID=A0ABW3H5D5_9SPHN|nr:serine hydrolase domain-containing protein [Sphingomonas canadensis]MCW3835663.1 beta-lactamase family protein [Sphingomonas canadensis]